MKQITMQVHTFTIRFIVTLIYLIILFWKLPISYTGRRYMEPILQY